MEGETAMNATVARIVEILFQDYEMSGEVQTIRDEVMSNCQERFEDCLARGLTEDEAIAAVLESLKGMDEVLAEYPKKQVTYSYADAQEKDDDDEEDGVLRFPGDAIHSIESNLVFEDFELESGDGSEWEVEVDGEAVDVKVEGGVLKLNHRSVQEVEAEGSAKESGAPRDFGWKYESGNTVSGMMSGIGGMMNELSGMFKDIGRMVRTNVRNVCGTINGSGRIVVRMPMSASCGVNAHSTSGDITIGEVRLTALRCESMSGDISVRLADAGLPEIHLRSTSGDIDASFRTSGIAGKVNTSTMSGDVRLSGNCEQMNVSTVSGDAEIRGDLGSVALNTVSGDAEIMLTGASAHVSMRTTSGDLRLKLPDPGMTVHAKLNSVSGDVHNHHADAGEHSSVVVIGQSVSGDITIR